MTEVVWNSVLLDTSFLSGGVTAGLGYQNGLLNSY